MKGFTKDLSAAAAIARHNFHAEVARHLLGYTWSILVPVIYAVCFVVVRQALSELHTEDSSFAILRAFVGVTLVQWWLRHLQEMSNFLRENQGLLRGLTISSRPLMLSVLLRSLLDLLIRLLTIAAAIVFLRPALAVDSSDIVPILMSLLSLISTSTAIGLVLAPWGALYADISKAISTASLPLLLLSPVFYAATVDPNTILYWINCLNPLASTLASLADATQNRDITYQYALGAWLLLTTSLAIWFIGKMKRFIPIILERIGG